MSRKATHVRLLSHGSRLISVLLADFHAFYPLLLRVLLVSLMISLYDLGSWSGMAAHAHTTVSHNQNGSHAATSHASIKKPTVPSFVGFSNSGVATGQDQDGRLEVFVRGNDNNIYGDWQKTPNDATGWNIYAMLEGGIPSGGFTDIPAVGRNSDGRLEVFARGNDGNMYHNAQSCAGCSFGSWTSLGSPSGGLQGSPAVIANKDGRLEVFARGPAPNNLMYHDYQCSSGCSWNGFVVVGNGGVPSGGFTDIPAVGRNSDGRLEVFTRGSDGNMYHNYQSCAGCNFGTWASLGSPSGGVKNSPAVGQNSDGRLEVFSLGTDGNMYHDYQCASGCAWSGFSLLGGKPPVTLQDSPAVGQNSDGRLEVFELGSDNTMYHNYQCLPGSCPNQGWNFWSSLGGPLTGLTGRPGAGRNQDGRLELLVLDNDTGLQDNYQCKSGYNCNWNGFLSLAALSTSAVDGLGERGFYRFYSQGINDRKQLRVNLGSGNLVFRSADVHIRGTGIDLDIDSYYNSLGDATSDLGNLWVLSTGADVHLRLNGDGSVLFYGSGGYATPYFRNSDGSYAIPPGMDASLVRNNDGSYTLSFHKTGLIFSFDSSGYVTAITDQNSNKVTFSYDNSHLLTSITDTQGRVTTFSYTAGTITTITDPAGRTVTYSYTNNELTSSTDQNGKTTKFGYSGNDLTTITDPLGNVTTISYLSGDKVSTITDATGAKTTFAYHPSTDSACSGIVSPAKACTVVTDANGHSTTFAYDSSDEIVGVKDANGHLTSTAYTPDNNVQSYTDALSNITTFNFSTDGKNNLTSITDGSGLVTLFGYGNTSHPYYPSSLTNPQGNQTTFGYDSQGNLNSSTDVSTGTTVSRVYNPNGTVASVKDGDGHQTTYSYDAKGNLTGVTPPSPLGSEKLTVDNLSRVTSVTDGKGQTTSFTYDKLDRVTKITYNGGATITYSYDANGNVVSVTDNTGTTSFTYDAVNRQVKKTLPNGTVISAGYDPVGNLTSVTDPGGAVTYTYDKVDLLATLTEPGGFQTTFSYDNSYRRIKEVYPNGVTISIGYNGAGRITSITAQNASGTLTSFTYSYNKNLRQSVTDESGNKTNYSNDTLDRLTSAKVYNSSGTQTNEYDYSYDGAGNRTSSKSGLNGATISYNYNAANELTSSSVVSSYSYDANGNLTGSSGGPSYAYNTKNQTTSIGPTNFTYTGPDQNERVQADNTNFTYSGLGLNSMTDSSGTTYYTRNNSGGLVDERTPSGRYYYLFDGLGSVVGLTDSSGNLVGKYQYDPYGNLTNTLGSTVLKNNPWRFASGFFDSSTNLYKFGIRYYDPSLGRWTQQDPVGGSLVNPGSSCRFAYANDDPVNLVDPSGRDCILDTLIAVLSILPVLAFGQWLVGLFESAAASALGLAAEAVFALPTIGEAFAAIVVSVGVILAAIAIQQVIVNCILPT